MFCCVIYVCENIKDVIPIKWIYEKPDKIIRKKHYLAFYSANKLVTAPPSYCLSINKSNKLKDTAIHKIYLHKIIGK